jgi:O-antigen ligase
MNTKKFDATLTKMMMFGPAAVSLFLIINSVTDPVNAPKLTILGGLGFSFAALILGSTLQRTWNESKVLLLVLCGFVTAMINSVINSKTPLSQNLYGVYGRNTGLITYLALVFVLLGALQVRNLASFRLLIFSFISVGIVNLIYCGWVLLFGDFIPWNNPYKKILGLFGNPDFISAYLGMFISALFAFIVLSKNKSQTKVIAILTCGGAFFEILKSHAIQGIAVTIFGLGTAIFFSIRSKFKTPLPQVVYGLTALISGVLGILGTLQIGPLSFIYKKSVSLRGSYWQAGINMGQSNPLTGVGMDAYGDSYRAARPSVALIDTPGPNVVTNAAHNVFLDLFAYGGWPLILAYCLVLVFTLFSVLRVTLRSKEYDPIFVTLIVIWGTYLIQSVISINQIGLAIWGWVTSGALIAYEIGSRPANLQLNQLVNQNTKAAKREYFITPNLIAGIGFVIGILVAAPPMSGDFKWKSAIDSRNIDSVEKALAPSYFNPANSYKYANAVILLSQNGFNDAAIKFARLAVEFNPQYSDAWRQLYSLPQSTAKDKDIALQNIKRLDPDNPDPLGLKP